MCVARGMGITAPQGIGTPGIIAIGPLDRISDPTVGDTIPTATVTAIRADTIVPTKTGMAGIIAVARDMKKDVTDAGFKQCSNWNSKGVTCRTVVGGRPFDRLFYFGHLR